MKHIDPFTNDNSNYKKLESIVADIRNKLSPFKNIIILYQEYQKDNSDELKEFIDMEIIQMEKNMPIIEAQLKQILN